VHTLVIKDVSVDDGGDYHVKATNRVGTTEATGKLSIVTEEPSFPKTLESITTKLGLTESFEVINNNNIKLKSNIQYVLKISITGCSSYVHEIFYLENKFKFLLNPRP
jgi:hypothetical protein